MKTSPTFIARPSPGGMMWFMTLADYLAEIRNVAAATDRLKEAISSADSAEEVDLFASRLMKACDALTKANALCKGTSRLDLAEAARILQEARRLLFVLKVKGMADEFPKLCELPVRCEVTGQT